MHISLRRLINAALTVITFTTLSIGVRSADKKVDPTGTWVWTFTMQNGDTIEPTLKIKAEGDKFVGKVTGRPGEEADIQNVKLVGDEISFQVAHERDGNKTGIKFNGKISGDAIKGTLEIDHNGDIAKHEWNPKRQSAAKTSAVKAAGTWKYSFTQNGQTTEPVLRLKQAGENLSGVVIMNDSETAISEAKLNGNEITFKVPHERNGQTSTSTYKGKIDGDDMKGTLTFTRNGEERSIELDAKRSKK
jgi:hypothetical protein